MDFEISPTDNLVWPREKNQSLASTRNPLREAQTWARSQSLRSNRLSLILGLGGGVHVVELLRRFPEKHLILVDPRSFCWKAFHQNCVRLNVTPAEKGRLTFIANEEALYEDLHLIVENQKIEVCGFLPCWGEKRDLFIKLRDELLQWGPSPFRLHKKTLWLEDFSEETISHPLFHLRDASIEANILKELFVCES